MLEKINDITNNTGSILGLMEPLLNESGGAIKIIDANAVAHARLQIDTRKLTMGKV